jgi:hypothetical protein
MPHQQAHHEEVEGDGLMEGEFKVLDWPGNSLDLDSIENC